MDNVDKYEILNFDGFKTVIHVDSNSEIWDLNGEGDPIKSETELRNFIHELYDQKCINKDCKDSLLDQI